MSSLKLNLSLPGPIVPRAGLYAAQTTQVTIETEGKIWIEIRSSTRIIASELFDFSEEGGSAALRDLEPGSGYILGVYAGILARDLTTGKISGKLRFASEQRIDLPPDQTVEATASLVLCDTILEQLQKEKAKECDPDFGVELAPPKPPVVFPVPQVTGCKVGDGDSNPENKAFVIAGSKPANTVIKDNNDNVVVNDGPAKAWLWNLSDLVFNANNFSRKIHTAHDFDQEIENTEEAILINYSVDPDAICFNPYQLAGAVVDVVAVGANQIELNWSPGAAITDVAILVVNAGTSISQVLSLTAFDEAQANDLLASNVAASTNDQELSFPRPATNYWDLYLYVREGAGWQVQGAFRYDAEWIAEINHPAGP